MSQMNSVAQAERMIKMKNRKDRNYLKLALSFLTFLALGTGYDVKVNCQEPDLSISGGIMVKHGGGIRGEVSKDDPASSVIQIQPTLGGYLVVPSSIVGSTSKLRAEQISYRRFSPLEKDDVPSQIKIANWANVNNLSGIANEHYQHVLEIDPENEEAHKALQHVKVNGVWVSNKERLDQNGLERINGRSVSKQEAELIRQQKSQEETAIYWKKEIKFLYQEALKGNQRARETFRTIRAPQALGPLLKTYASEKKNPEGRILLLQGMAAIGTPASLAELGKIAISDPDADVRVAAVEGILLKREATADAIEYFKRRLRSEIDVDAINSAAYALGRLKGKSAIPDLINSLVTTHKRQIVTGTDKTGMSVDGTGKISGFSPGGGVKTQTITEVSQNKMVHEALVLIVADNYSSPVDFGYDVSQWIRWQREVEQLSNFYPRRDQ